MRPTLALVLLVVGCESGSKAAIQEAQKQAEAEQKLKGPVEPPKKMIPPVPGEAKLPCTQLINIAAFQSGLEEKEPLSVKDTTQPKGDVAASCDVVRGGKKLSEAEQQKLLKETGRLGILSGDVVCNIRLLCYTFESTERVKERCARMKENDNDTMGSYACVQIVPTGVHDVEVFKFFDEDTKCVFEVRGGPSNTDNNVIRSCAKIARDTIGPDQIKPGAAPATPPADSGSGSGS